MKRVMLVIVAILVVTIGAMVILAQSAPSFAAPSPDRNAHRHDRDAQLAAIAERVPGFGGVFFDEDGRPTVYVRDLSRAQEARAAVVDLLAGRQTRRGGSAAALDAGDIVVRRGDYDFGRLVEWKQSLIDVLSLPGVVFLDVDERKNRLLVGIEPGADPEPVKKLVTQRGIPQAAVIVAEAEPIKTAATLQDHVRPVVGGLQISFSDSRGTWLCTLGAPVYLGRMGFITNSHCTDTPGQVKGTYYYQPVSGSSYLIGNESVDPPFFTTEGLCPAGRRCRWSDAAFAYFRSGVSYEYATIARTYYRDTWIGSLTITGSLPIVGKTLWPTVGEKLDKIGRTTGWTSGEVTNACVHVNVNDLPGVTLLCQDMVQAGVKGGDSGSPVFKYDIVNGTANLYGLLWGSTQDSFIFSSMWNIEREIGSVGID